MAWKTGRVRIELNGEGIRELLLSNEVAADLKRRGDAVKAAAEGRYAELPVGARDKGQPDGVKETEIIPVTVTEPSRTNRAAVVISGDHPAAQAVESKHRVLGQSIDAARE